MYLETYFSIIVFFFVYIFFFQVVATPVLFFAIWHAFVSNQYGRLIKYMVKLLEDKPNEEYEKKLIEYAEMLNWTHVAKHLRRLLPSKYPTSYQPF